MNTKHSTTSFLVTLVLVAGVVATVFSFLGRLGWVFDLFSHFHLQYAWFLLAVAVCCAVGRRWWPAAAGLVLALPHLWCLGYYVPGGKPDPSGGQPSIEVVAFNVFTANRRHAEVLDFLCGCDADLILVMEADGEWLEELRPLEASHPQFRLHPRGDNFGMALYSRLPIVDAKVLHLPGKLPCIVARLDWDGGPLTVIGAHPYPPFGGAGSVIRDGYLEQVGVLAREASADSGVIVLGDLNTTPWSPGFRELLSAAELRDSGRRRGFRSTWRRRNPVFSLPIDHILHGPGLETIEHWIGPGLGSDHRAVGARIRRSPEG